MIPSHARLLADAILGASTLSQLVVIMRSYQGLLQASRRSFQKFSSRHTRDAEVVRRMLCSVPVSDKAPTCIISMLQGEDGLIEGRRGSDDRSRAPCSPFDRKVLCLSMAPEAKAPTWHDRTKSIESTRYNTGIPRSLRVLQASLQKETHMACSLLTGVFEEYVSSTSPGNKGDRFNVLHEL